MPGLGARLPLSISVSEGPYDLLQNIKEMAAQNLKMVIFTSPGERIMDPDFGVGIRKFLFQQKTPLIFSDIREKLDEQVAKYLPFVEVVDVLFDSSDEDQYANILIVRIEYFVIPLGKFSALNVVVDAIASSEGAEYA